MTIPGGSSRENAQQNTIHVLWVGPTPDGTARATGLERANDRFETSTVASADAGLESLTKRPVDCIVSVYELPETDGLELLRRVRARDETIPFVLFPENGSEALASDAMAAGVTDYVLRDERTGQCSVLADRIISAVETTRIRRQRKRQFQAVETAQEGISILDSSGRFTYVNRSYADCFGYDPDALIGEHWEILYEDDEATFVTEELLPMVMESGSWRGESVCVRADERPIVVDHTLSRTEHDDLICTVRDITDRKARERELERYETILEAIPDEVYVLDADGVFTNVIPPTDADLTTTGYQPDELIGEHVSLVLDDEDIAAGEREIRRLLKRDDHKKASFELDLHTKDGNQFPNENHIALLPQDEDGTFRGTVGVLRDITERKTRERTLKRQNARLESFASIVSHDLRNPLNVAQGKLELAREQADSDHLGAVEAAHERMQRLIEDILLVAREDRPVTEPEPIALAPVVRSCWNHVETDTANLEVTTDSVVYGDRSRLKRLLENLIRNSVEHGSTRPDSHARQNSVEHGSTAPAGRSRRDDRPTDDTTAVTVTVGTLPSGFYVADDGPGIPPDERDSVFETGYSRAGGTGFGLAIVERIADAHGWSVTVTESEAGGARFEFRGVETDG
ncbi:hybrid sensor histidine kinase/response regulator [Natronorubrum sulfidifaciens]|uniref:histidine kinase n=1 Tax=Natronorubrum sulfidifaciens JCM 14089 TaxID=1230460 RepID=L9WA38_9EURY|nr:PAS domain S-box protein [Natronorubrum sulfidifaciens]ELY45178.1 PAS sensor protein [Natronorubrum sulfidifaciens JCM 14089]